MQMLYLSFIVNAEWQTASVGNTAHINQTYTILLDVPISLPWLQRELEKLISDLWQLS